MSSDQGASRIALAGIAATAVVGIFGSVSGWLVARDDRATQRALAHDARIFDRRAKAYVDALSAMQQVRRDLNHITGEWSGGNRTTKEYEKAVARADRAVDRLNAQRAKVLAFGSREASRVYANARLQSESGVAWAYERNFNAYEATHNLYDTSSRYFERVVQQELG
jgi:hypothetical protein